MLSHMWRRSSFLVLTFVFATGCYAQDTAPSSEPAGPPATETLQQLRTRLAPAPRQQLDDAMAAFNAGHFADALAQLKPLRERHPRDAVLAKLVSEASLNTGDTASALAILNPLVESTPNDWQAVALLARTCAEPGDTACRDREMAQMLALHHQGLIPSAMKEYPVEHIKAGANTLIILTALEPFGIYKIYDVGRVTNADGKLFLTATIESNEPDQATFAKQYPKEAEQGVRLFSLDAYAETGLNQAGQRTQTHYTYAFFHGPPTYDAIRENFLKIANGKASPMSSRSGLIVP